MSIEVDNAGGSNNNGNKQADVKSAAPQAQQQTQSVSAQASQNTGAASSAGQQPKSIKQQISQGTRSMISTRQNYGMSRAATSQAMRAIIEITDKIAEGEPDQPVKYTFFPLDGEKEGLLISALVVVATLKNPGNDSLYASHHTLLLAQTARGASAVEAQAQFGQNIKYERLVVPSEAYDATLRARVVEVVQGAFPGYALIDADACVVPSDLDLRSEEAVRNVMANATTAASTMLASQVADDGWVIDQNVLQHTFQTDIKSSWHHLADLTGQPVRGDVVLEMSMLTGRPQTQQNTGEFQYNTSQARKLLTQLMGYIDTVSTPPQQVSSFAPNANIAQTPEQLRIYTPRLVITNMDAPDEAVELPVILQGLGTVQALINEHRWIGALVKQHVNGAAHQEGGLNIRDLSAIGLEAPQQVLPGMMLTELPKPGRLPLNSANVNEAMLAAAIQTYYNLDTMLVSLDVPECGASSWITAPFAAAARGDKNAERDIIEAADLLTGNRFSEIYKAANGGVHRPPVFNDNMYVNLGFYYGQGGVKRDIRDIDYLAVLNMTGDSELETINDWANLQANADIDPMFRLASTREIQSRLFESLTITGRAVRVTFNPAFIFALAEAVAQAGLVYETKVGVAAPQGTARMVASYMRNLPTGLGNAGAFMAQGMRRASPTGLGGVGSFGRYANMRAPGNTGSGNY